MLVNTLVDNRENDLRSSTEGCIIEQPLWKSLSLFPVLRSKASGEITWDLATLCVWMTYALTVLLKSHYVKLWVPLNLSWVGQTSHTQGSKACRLPPCAQPNCHLSKKCSQRFIHQNFILNYCNQTYFHMRNFVIFVEKSCFFLKKFDLIIH